MTAQDFYAGFEGEPEMRFSLVVNGKTLSEIIAWGGYFDRLMEHVTPGPDGWQGFAVHYHVLTGWNGVELERWVDPDVVDTLKQIEAAAQLCPEGAGRTFATALTELLRDAAALPGSAVVFESR